MSRILSRSYSRSYAPHPRPGQVDICRLDSPVGRSVNATVYGYTFLLTTLGREIYRAGEVRRKRRCPDGESIQTPCPAALAAHVVAAAAVPDTGWRSAPVRSRAPGAYPFVSSSAFSSAAEMMKFERLRRSISVASLSFAFSAAAASELPVIAPALAID